MRRWAVMAVLAVVAAGCGSGPEVAAPRQDILSVTAQRLGTIKSGVLSMKLLARAGTDDEVGFELEGPFSLGDSGALPIARLQVTEVTGATRRVSRLVSNGVTAYVEADGRRVELSPEQLNELRGPTPSSSGGSAPATTSAFGELRVDRWIESPTVSDGGVVGGAATDRVQARLRVVNAVNDLIAMSRRLGAAPGPQIEGDDATRLERAVTGATFDLYTGKEDRLLRRLLMEADLGKGDIPALGGLSQTHISFELSIQDPNRPIPAS